MAFEKTDRPERMERPAERPTGDRMDDDRPPPPPRERRSFGDRRPMGGPRTETSRCRTPGCVKYHDFFQWNGKYYCLECYETLRNAEREMTAQA